jgi:hypothetical protein
MLNPEEATDCRVTNNSPDKSQQQQQVTLRPVSLEPTSLIQLATANQQHVTACPNTTNIPHTTTIPGNRKK